MFNSHPLGHSILGTVEGIQASTAESVKDFYQSRYLSNNAVFVIAGKFDPSKTRRLIDRYFPVNAGAGDVLPAQAVKSPEREASFHAERDFEQVHFCLGVDGITKKDPARWSLYALSTVLGGSMSSRLFQNIREKEGICYSIYSFHSSYSDTGLFGIYCATSPEYYLMALDLIMKECEKLLKEGLSRDEFEDTKTYMKGNLALSFENMEVRMGQLARNEISFNRYYSFQDLQNEIDKITIDDVIEITNRIFNKKRFTIVSAGNIPSGQTESFGFYLSV
jgi:predicted Zn-dependent peptidase